MGREYRPGQIKHPSYMGTFIDKFIYDALPPAVADELKRRLPKNEHGNRKAQPWQILTVDTGSPQLDKQLNDGVLLTEVSDDKKAFEQNWKKEWGVQWFLPMDVVKQLQSSH
jgi:hypothetical protein